MFAQLHVRTWFSFQGGASSPEAMAQRAASQGVGALCITDRNGVYGAIRHQLACEANGIKPLFGAEVTVDGAPLVLIARTRTGYTNLNHLLTIGFQQTALPELDLAPEQLHGHTRDLICFTGGADGKLWNLLLDYKYHEAREWVDRLKSLFGRDLYIELTNQLRRDDRTMVERLHRFAGEMHIPVVATGDVRYAVADDYALYDLMICMDNNQTIFEGHPDRPSNDQAFLRNEATMRRLIPHPEAFTNASRIAKACKVNLIPEEIIPPGADLPPGTDPNAHLRRLCEEGLMERYHYKGIEVARKQFEHEFNVIKGLDLAEFFLVVREVMDEAKRRGIRCAGRGSAANSIIAYLLGITKVDPIEHNLLFERFLHAGRKGTPDIDLDFDSARRLEVVGWMEERFGIHQTAMAATLMTYQLRSAIRDVAKALGYTEHVLGQFKQLPRRSALAVDENRELIFRIVGGETPLSRSLINMVRQLAGCPRHLGQHSGGMVLSRTDLNRFTPVQVSANSVNIVQFDKYDLEHLGLVKLDVLGLRMLSAVSYAEEIINRTVDPSFELDRLTFDDEPTYEMIRRGETIGLFQIESQGQLHLLAMNQPENFDDLVVEIALFRPGPVQGGMVRPFVQRRKGLIPVEYEHPLLEPILHDTCGIIIFQEQVLEVAHQFAGMALDKADRFRQLMSKFRDPGQMEDMRTVFVQGAMNQGVSEEIANSVFEKVSKFVGFGFCRSHAAAFAQTVYHSAYLKCHHPAAFMAAAMQHHPGMYPRMTLEQEAKRRGVDVLVPDINASGILYDVELSDGKYAVRKPLTSIATVSTEDAQAIVLERMNGPFESVEDLFNRVSVKKDSLEAIARSGAMDHLTKDSRTALWEVGVLVQRSGVAGQSDPQHALFEHTTIQPADIPDLPRLEMNERITWDYQTHSAARRHPMTLARRQLNALEVRPIEVCYQYKEPVRRGKEPVMTTAGISILRQRPGTAKGFMFLTLEDETGFIQCVIPPAAQDLLGHVLSSSSLIVRGLLQAEKNWRGLILQQAWRLDGIMGGYEGHAGAHGGRDNWVRVAKARLQNPTLI